MNEFNCAMIWCGVGCLGFEKVNYPTAWNMLKDFVDLKEEDWVIQNGANSAVSRLLFYCLSKS